MFRIYLLTLVTILFVSASSDHFYRKPALYQVTPPIDHGEEPIWDYRTGLLYFVNVYEGQILSFNPKSSKLNTITIGHFVGAVIPTKSNPHLLIVGQNTSLISVEWDGRNEVGTIKEVTKVTQFPTSRFNDGKADSKGNLWIGTMGFKGPTGIALNEGILYFVNKSNIANPLPVLHPVNISNGLAWNKANNKFYYIDTLTFSVAEYNYDSTTESIFNPRVVFDVTKHPEISGSYPDGMTIDVDGNLWIALNLGGSVIKVDPKTGDMLQRIAIPSSTVTSVNWGGDNLDILFVTTSRHLLSDTDKIRQPAAGSLFAITNLGTHGLPVDYVDIL